MLHFNDVMRPVIDAQRERGEEGRERDRVRCSIREKGDTDETNRWTNIFINDATPLKDDVRLTN